MTDRAEIERLLNQTGRTLEGLPENYGVRKRELWATFVDREEGHLKSLEMANTILHQSDVIELLVGALRDAMDKPMQKPLTLEEIKQSVYQIPCWVEYTETTGLYPDVIDRDSRGVFSKTTKSFMPYFDLNTYGKYWRAWTAKPTDEEREAAAWET